MLTAPAHLNLDIPIWREAQLRSNGVRQYSNPQHGGVMGLSLYQPLGHRPTWLTLIKFPFFVFHDLSNHPLYLLSLPPLPSKETSYIVLKSNGTNFFSLKPNQ